MAVFNWIYGTIFLVGGAILIIVLGQVLQGYIYPIATNSTAMNITAEDRAEAAIWYNMWHYLPILLFVLFGIYVISRTIQNRENYY